MQQSKLQCFIGVLAMMWIFFELIRKGSGSMIGLALFLKELMSNFSFDIVTAT